MSEKKPHIPRRSSPTSFDVARKAGVSQAAVSYVFNDKYACYLLRALMEREIRVPQEIAIVGTEDLLSCELTWPSLTSIRFDNVDAIGKRAVDMLIDLYTGQPVPEPLSFQLVPQLIQRESS